MKDIYNYNYSEFKAIGFDLVLDAQLATINLQATSFNLAES